MRSRRFTQFQLSFSFDSRDLVRGKDEMQIPKMLYEMGAQLGVNRDGGWLRGVY